MNLMNNTKQSKHNKGENGKIFQPKLAINLSS